MLLSKVVKLQAVVPDVLPPQKETTTFDKEKKFRPTNGQPFYKKSEVAMATTEERGKKVASTENAHRPPKPIWYKETLEEKKNKKYSFKKDSVSFLFDKMSKKGLRLPEIRRPKEANQVDHPLYCPFHRFLGHTIEDCWSFKDLVEDKYQKNEIRIADEHLLPITSIHMIQHVNPTLARHVELPHGQTGQECTEKIVSINMVWHTHEEVQPEEENCDLAQQAKEKDERITHLELHLGGMIESMNKLAIQIKELEKASSSRRRTPRMAKGKEKMVATIENTLKPTKPTHHRESIEEKRNKKYSFNREGVKSLFYMMLENGLQLPKPKRPEQVDMMDHPSYCHYHRNLGHQVEDCWSFKNILEDRYQEKVVRIPKRYLLPQPITVPQKSKPKLKIKMNYDLDCGVPIGTYLGSPESSKGEQIVYKPPRVTRKQEHPERSLLK